MAANNEIGMLQPLAEIGAIAHERGALFHTDAAQAAGKIPIDVRAMNIDLLSLTGAQVLRPEGLRRAVRPRRRSRGSRSRCRSTAAARRTGCAPARSTCRASSGSARAAEICRLEMAAEARRLGALRDRLLDGLRARLDGVRVNGRSTQRLPHNLHVSFDGIEGEALLMALGDLAVSTGSACSSGSQAPSHVLQAIGAVGAGPARRSVSASAARRPSRDRLRHRPRTTVVRSLPPAPAP